MTAERASLEWLENPEVFQVNREKAHSDHLFYEKEEEVCLEDRLPLSQWCAWRRTFLTGESPESAR